MKRLLPFTREHEMFRDALGKFLDNEIVPNYPTWEQNHIVPREIFKLFGDYGYLCSWADEEYGGVNADFLYSVIMVEELGARGLNGLFTRTHDIIIVPYINSFGTKEQKDRWMPGCVSGDLITAVAMTEPGAGSDLASIRTSAKLDGDHYVVNGSKTFISLGTNADLFVTAVKTDPTAKPAHRGISLLVIEAGTPGFEKGKIIEKIGLHAQDTTELFFDNCRVPKENLLGEEGKGFYYLMQKLQQERISASLTGLAKAERALALTIPYVQERVLFGKQLSKFQNTQFELAKAATEISLAKAHLDTLIIHHMNGENIVKEVSMAKYYCCDLSFRTASRCLQLFGGYGYCKEYPISSLFVDARIDSIFAGTAEIMLTIIAKEMGL